MTCRQIPPVFFVDESSSCRVAPRSAAGAAGERGKLHSGVKMHVRRGRFQPHPEFAASRRPHASECGREAVMWKCRIVRSLPIALAVAALAIVAQTSASDRTAADCDAASGFSADGSCARRPFGGVCSRCGAKVCVTYASPGKETRRCWEVECAEVCIPPVRFPWQCRKSSGCSESASTLLPGCGKVRCVRRLKAIEYECDTCEYEHRIVCRCPNCGPLPQVECVPSPASSPAAEGS